VGFSGENDGDFLAVEAYFPFAFDEVAVELGCIAAFKSPKLPGQHAVEGIGDHGHDDIKMDLDQDGGRERIEVEELYRLGDDVFDSPSARVVSHQRFQRGREVIGDKEGGLFVAVCADDHLAQVTDIILQCDEGLMDQRVGIFAFAMGDVDPFPGTDPIEPIQHALASASQGDESDPLLIELREFGIGGELGIKDKGGFDASLDLFPEGQKAQYLIIGFTALDVGRCVEDQFGCRILGKKGKSSFHPFVPGSSPMRLKYGFFPKVGDGMKVQIDDAGVVKPESGRLLDKALLQAHKINCIQCIGIGRHGRAFGQHVEPGKKTQGRIKAMIADMGVTLVADQFEG